MVVPNSFIMTISTDPVMVITDDGNGVLQSTNALFSSGTIDYYAETFTLHFTSAVPDTTPTELVYDRLFSYHTQFVRILDSSKSFYGGTKAVVLEFNTDENANPELKVVEFQNNNNVLGDSYYEKGMLLKYQTGNLDLVPDYPDLQEKVKALNWVHLTYYVSSPTGNTSGGKAIYFDMPLNLTINVYTDFNTTPAQTVLVVPSAAGINHDKINLDPRVCKGKHLSFEILYPIVPETSSTEFSVIDMLVDFNIEGEVV